MTIETLTPTVTVGQNLTTLQRSANDGTYPIFHGTPIPFPLQRAFDNGLLEEGNTGHSGILIYVTEQLEDHSHIRMAKLVRQAVEQDDMYWTRHSDNPRPHRYVRGALVSPTLISGKVYSISNSFTVQFFDDEHAEHRYQSSRPFNILGYRGAAWSPIRDSLLEMSPIYIEVEAPDNAIPASVYAPETVAEPVTEPIRQLIDTATIQSLEGIHFSFAGEPIECPRNQAMAAGQGTRDTPLGLIVTSNLAETTRLNNRLYRVRMEEAAEHADGRIFAATAVTANLPRENYVRGAVLTPSLISGKTYSIDGGYTVQYFSDTDMIYRNDPLHEFNVLDYQGSPVSQSALPMSGMGRFYVEIVPPTNAKDYPMVATESVPAPEPEVRTEPVTVTGQELVDRVIADFAPHVAGHPVVEIPTPRGRVAPHKEFILVRGGVAYACQSDRDGDLNMEYRFDSATIPVEGLAQYNFRRLTDFTLVQEGDRAFEAKRNGRPMVNTPDVEAGLVSTLTARITAAESRWADMGEALNEMARNQSWCSEYEEAVTPLGWPGRHGGNRDYDITVQVNWSYETSSTSSDLDNYLRDDTNVDTNDVDNFEIDELTMSGTAYVTLRNIEMPVDDEDLDYDEYISSDAVDRLMPSGYNVDDWSYSERNESD